MMNGPARSQQAPRVLVVDDDSMSRAILRLLLQEHGCSVREADSGEAAVELVRKEPPDLILLDVEMDGVNGFDVVRSLKTDEHTRAIPVVMVTGLADRESRLKALENGAEDYLIKPVDPAELQVRVRNHLRLKEYGDLLQSMNRILEDRVREKTAELLDYHKQTIYLLMSAAEHRDEVTGAHVKRISHYASTLARRLGTGAEFADTIFWASPMHDIGKIGIPDSILLKPGPLSPAEWDVMRTHPTLGREILRGGTSPYLVMGATIAQTHHECWDGSGYPAGLKGEAIPLPGRIMLLCDQYDALRSSRPYKPAFDHRATVKILTEGDGRTRPGQFCPSVFSAFEGCAGEFETIYAEQS